MTLSCNPALPSRVFSWGVVLPICLFLGVSSSVFAQSIPRPIPPQPQPPPQVEPLPPPDELLEPPEPPNQPERPPLQVPGTITVQQFEVRGSTVFSAEELATVLQPFTQRPISFSELIEAQQAVTQLYIKNGYITSGAFIPPQTLTDGLVVIEVIEGAIEEIEISGLERLRRGYVQSRVELGIQPPLNQTALLSALQLLQINLLVEDLSAELSAGSRPGLSRLELELEEAEALAVELAVDNYRSPSVGSFRRLAQLTHDNLTGRGDRLNVTYYNTDGSNTLDDLSYTLPINAKNGTIQLSHRRTDSRVIETPFDELNIESNSQTYELSYRQPLILNPSTEFALGVTASLQDTETLLEDEPFPLSLGADEDGQTRIAALRLFQEYTTRSTEDVFAVRSQFSFGLGLLDATVNDANLPDSQFFVWRTQAQYLRILAPDTFLLLRSDLQLTEDALLNQEQFSLGGVSSVRGYRQDALLADSGVFLSAEVQIPVLRITGWDTLVTLTPFFDWGTLWNSNELVGVELDQSSLSSVGLGLKLLVSDNFVAQLDWGIPLVELSDTGDSLQEDGLYFSVRYRASF